MMLAEHGRGPGLVGRGQQAGAGARPGRKLHIQQIERPGRFGAQRFQQSGVGFGVKRGLPALARGAQRDQQRRLPGGAAHGLHSPDQPQVALVGQRVQPQLNDIPGGGRGLRLQRGGLGQQRRDRHNDAAAPRPGPAGRRKRDAAQSHIRHGLTSPKKCETMMKRHIN